MHDLTELKRLVGWLEEAVRKLEILLEPGYGGTASELVRLLQEQETRDATAATRLAQLEEEALRWYLPDGSYEVLASRDEVVARRKVAAGAIATQGNLLVRASKYIAEMSEYYQDLDDREGLERWLAEYHETLRDTMKLEDGK